MFDCPAGVGPVVRLRDKQDHILSINGEIHLWKVKEGSREPMRRSLSHDETLPHKSILPDIHTTLKKIVAVRERET